MFSAATTRLGRRIAARVLVWPLVFAAVVCAWPLADSAQAEVITINATVSPSTLVANGSDPATITATVTSDVNGPVAGDSVTFTSSDPGQTISPTSPTPAITDANGVATASLTSSTTVGTSNIVASDASVSSSPAGLTQTAGPPATMTIALNPSTIVADGLSNATATATVRDRQGHPVNDDAIQFSSSDPGQTVSPTPAITNANGVATATLTSSTTVGTSNIVASDASVSSSPAGLTQTAGPPATMTIALNPSTIVADGLSNATATATVRDRQGHPVNDDATQFSSSDPGQTVSARSKGAVGTYTAAIRSSTKAGKATITASDGGSLTARTTLTQASGPTKVSMLVSQSTAVTNESVAVWAAVTATGGQPSGTITFLSRGAALPNCAGEPITPQNAIASCQASFAAAASPVTITAIFRPGQGSAAAGASASTVLHVTRDSSSIALSAPGTTRVGQRTTYTADISPRPTRPGSVVPSGSVAFFDHGKQISSCGAVAVQSGRSTCTVTYKAVGSHSITARYGGDANFTGSMSLARVVNMSSPPVLGIISATMQWTFRFTPKYTTILQFGISGAANTSITAACRGSGCPFAKRTITVGRTKRCGRGLRRTCLTRGKLDLVHYFLHHRLRAGTTITVLISRKSWVGKHYAFTMRARRGPAIAISCMAPGETRVGVGCST